MRQRTALVESRPLDASGMAIVERPAGGYPPVTITASPDSTGDGTRTGASSSMRHTSRPVASSEARTIRGELVMMSARSPCCATSGVDHEGCASRFCRQRCLPVSSSNAARNESVCSSFCTMTRSPAITGELAGPHCVSGLSNIPTFMSPKSLRHSNRPSTSQQNRPSEPMSATTCFPSVAGVADAKLDFRWWRDRGRPLYAVCCHSHPAGRAIERVDAPLVVEDAGGHRDADESPSRP